MNFFTRLLGDLGIGKGASQPNYANGVTGAIGAVMSHSLAFRLGRYQITATSGDAQSATPSTPVHFTFAAAMLGVEMALAGETGVFQSGVITVTVGILPGAPPANPTSV